MTNVAEEVVQFASKTMRKKQELCCHTRITGDGGWRRWTRKTEAGLLEMRLKPGEGTWTRNQTGS